ncbi:MAG: hypothetical protein ABR499_07970 [Gemmatimonadaceae bacterium]
MPTAREDYLIRLIQQLGIMLRRLRERLTGETSVAEATEVEREAGQAIATLLGPQAPLLNQLDATSAARLLGDAGRVSLWVAFLRVQADARRASGGAEAAERLTARAAALEQAARAVWP